MRTLNGTARRMRGFFQVAIGAALFALFSGIAMLATDHEREQAQYAATTEKAVLEESAADQVELSMFERQPGAVPDNGVQEGADTPGHTTPEW